MPKKIKRLWRFGVAIPNSEDLIPCDAFFEKYPALLPSFTIANCFGVKLFYLQALAGDLSVTRR
jgi:hypothetical protein